jgi:hypothetical protein
MSELSTFSTPIASLFERPDAGSEAGLGLLRDPRVINPTPTPLPNYQPKKIHQK